MRGRRCIGLVWHIPTNHLISIAAKTVLETQYHHHPQAAPAAKIINLLNTKLSITPSLKVFHQQF